MQDRTVLIVTHYKEIAQLLAQILEAGGYVPDIAPRADALSRTASITHPALVLLDCDHEAVHGIEAARSDRSGGVALFSPSRLPDEVRLLGDRYGVPFVTLPIEPRKLLRFVGSCIAAAEARATRDRATVGQTEQDNSSAA